MEEFSKGDLVFIKSDYEKNIFESYEICCLNKSYAIIITNKNSEIYKKVSLDRLTKTIHNVVNAEHIKKGDLVKCVVNNTAVQEGLVINTYNTFVLVLIGLKKKKISKNRVIVINN